MGVVAYVGFCRSYCCTISLPISYEEGIQSPILLGACFSRFAWYQFSRDNFWSKGVTYCPFPMSNRKFGVSKVGQILPSSSAFFTLFLDAPAGAVAARCSSRFLLASECILLIAPSRCSCHRYWLVRNVLLNS